MIFGQPEYIKLLTEVCRSSDPKRHDLYEETCHHAKEMSVHLYGDKPVHLLGKIRPGEDLEIKKYRLDIWEPVTKSAADKALTILSKIFNPNLWSIVWQNPNDRSEQLKKYTFEYYPVYNSLISYNKEVMFRKMLADPNAVQVIRPEKFPETTSETIKPIVLIYGSHSIWYMDDEHYLFFKKEEKTRDGKFYYFDYVDNEKLGSFVVHPIKNGEIQILDEFFYVHGFVDKDGVKEIPAWKLRGYSDSLDNGEIIFKSFIYSASPHWNKAIIHDSDVDGAYIKHLNPQRYRIGEECQHFIERDGAEYHCRNGYIKMGDPTDPNVGMIMCPKCKGSGHAVTSPYQDFVIPKTKLDPETPFPPIGYVSVPVDATKMVEEKVYAHIKKGMWAINMDIEDKVGENQSGIAKVIDRSAQNDKMYEIATVEFDIHLNNQYYFMNKYMFGVTDRSADRNSDDNLPQINKPTRFDIQSITELVDSYSVSSKSGLDKNYLKTQQKEIISKDLSTNPQEKKRALFLIDIDPLPGCSVDEVLSMEGKIKNTDAVIHFNLSNFLDKALMENDKFMELERKKQIEKFEEYAEEVIEDSGIDPDMLSPDDPEPTF